MSLNPRILDGGTVNVFGVFGLGWSKGTGYVNVRNGGILDLSSFYPAQSISEASGINIEAGPQESVGCGTFVRI